MEIRQILMNLVLNARDAMPEGGQIILRTSRWDSTGMGPDHRPLKPGPFAWLSVIDTGTGMGEETQKHIFEPFFTTKETGKGTGLGLATVYGIAEKRGGCVWLESEPGKGSAFHLCLPFSPSAGNKLS
jgi:two-component system cell cycle sensor histidine kinase/response regulator CckA